MNNPFGPWATAMHGGSNPQLSTFWRRRLERLPAVAANTPAISRPCMSLLVITALAIGAMPTLYGSDAPPAVDKAAIGLPDGPQAKQDSPEQLLQIVKQATIQSWNALVSGQGRGTCTVKLKGKPEEKFDFEIACDGDKFSFVMIENPYRRQIAVSDGSATLVRWYRDELDSASRATCIIMEPQFTDVRPVLQVPQINLPKGTRGVLAPTCFDKIPIKVVKLPDGRLQGAFDINKYVAVSFDATSDSGYNVSREECFNKIGSRTGSIYTAQWKRDRNVWYVAAMTREYWSQGAVVERAEMQYAEFTANPRLPSELFSIRALHLRPGSTIIDGRSGSSKTYMVGDPVKLAESKPTIAEQVATLRFESSWPLPNWSH